MIRALYDRVSMSQQSTVKKKFVASQDGKVFYVADNRADAEAAAGGNSSAWETLDILLDDLGYLLGEIVDLSLPAGVFDFDEMRVDINPVYFRGINGK